MGGLIHGGVTSVWLVELRAKEPSQKETILSLSLPLSSTSIIGI